MEPMIQIKWEIVAMFVGAAVIWVIVEGVILDRQSPIAPILSLLGGSLIYKFLCNKKPFWVWLKQDGFAQILCVLVIAGCVWAAVYWLWTYGPRIRLPRNVKSGVSDLIAPFQGDRIMLHGTFSYEAAVDMLLNNRYRIRDRIDAGLWMTNLFEFACEYAMRNGAKGFVVAMRITGKTDIVDHGMNKWCCEMPDGTYDKDGVWHKFQVEESRYYRFEGVRPIAIYDINGNLVMGKHCL